jgi:hypothetical protein
MNEINQRVSYTEQPENPNIVIELPGLLNQSPSLLPLIAAIAFLWKYFFQPKSAKLANSFRSTVDEDQIILGTLYKILSESKADRVTLIQAHNGTVFTSGRHDWKVSITHEAFNRGIESLKQKFQNVRASQINEVLTTLFRDKKVQYEDPEDIPDIYIQNYYLLNGIKQSVTYVLETNTEGTLGFVAIHYSEEDGLINFEEKTINPIIKEMRALLSVRQNNLFSNLLRKIKN